MEKRRKKIPENLLFFSHSELELRFFFRYLRSNKTMGNEIIL